MKAWYEDFQKSTLSEYGCHKLIDAIQFTTKCQNKTQLNKFTVVNSSNDNEALNCPRCTRFHKGGPENCRSLKMVIRDSDQETRHENRFPDCQRFMDQKQNFGSFFSSNFCHIISSV